MRVTFDGTDFAKEMNNLMEYSLGFLDGVKAGKKVFLENLGVNVVETLKEFIDSNARIDPQMLHHVYEWYETGSPEGRLFDIDYTVSNLGLSFKSSFSQSRTIQDGSNVPFYNKAKIMEEGVPVVITPKDSGVLAFDIDGHTVFSHGPIVVENPGGTYVHGQFEKTFDLFFKSYFSQAFLRSSGISEYLKSPKVYKNNLSSGKSGGKPVGFTTGYRWIANAGVAL